MNFYSIGLVIRPTNPATAPGFFCFWISAASYLKHHQSIGANVKKAVVIAAMVASFCTLPARAFEAPKVVGLHLATLHSESGFCNLNPGAYAVWEGGFTVGAYRNSECAKVSAYAGWTWQTEGRLRAGITAGLITGYRRAPVMPLLVPSVALDLSPTATLRLSFLPKVEKGGAAALHFSVEFPI